MKNLNFLLFALITLITLLAGAGPARAQTWQWALTPGSTGTASGTTMERALATDPQGNVYVAGQMGGTVSFGTTTLTGLGGFVGKLNPAGQWQWARLIPRGQFDQLGMGGGVADAAGNLYLTGGMQGTATFGTTVLTTAAYSELFVAKINALGQWQWATRTTGSGTGTSGSSANGVGLALDPATGDPVVVGYSNNIVTYGATTLAALAGTNGVVARLSAGTGQWLWATALATTSQDALNGVACDAAGEIYVSGIVTDDLQLGTLPILQGRSADGVVAKLAGNGQTWRWATRVGGSGTDYAVAALPLASGEVAVTGSFQNGFFLGGALIQAAGDFDVFLVRLDAAGAVVAGSAQKAGGIGRDEVRSMVADAAGNLVLSGNYNAPITFGATTYPQALQTYATAFVASSPAGGGWGWVATAGGNGNVFAYALAADAMGNYLYTGGVVAGTTAQFGTLPGFTTGGAFVARLTNARPTATRPATLGGQAISLWPNPAQGRCAVQLPALPGGQPVAAVLHDGLGRVVRQWALPGGTTSGLDVAGLPAGLYALRLRAGPETTTLRLALE